MSSLPLVSSLGRSIAEFIDEKRANGYRYVSEVGLLRLFDRYLVSVGHTSCDLPKSVVQGWACKRPHESAVTHGHRVCVLRQFAQFLLRRGIHAHVPFPLTSSVRRNNFKPWVFTRAQMRDLLSAVDAMGETSQSPIRHLVMPELLRVLYGCGLRCGEAVRLTVGDVDLNEGVLTIREGKFLRDRLTPVAPALLRRLRVYASAICGRTPDSSFFPGPHGGAYSVQTVYAVFRRLLRIVGISHGGRGVGPRLHDIRATFAVHRVEAWYREGADLGVKLPILSAYMGHRSLTGTQRYLRLTMAIFPELTRHFEQAYGHLVPILPEP